MIPRKNKDLILIFDTNIFLTGIDFNVIDGLIYTTPQIIEEIKVAKYSNKNRNILNKIQAAIDSKKLILKTPSKKYIEKVENISKITGDVNALSIPDKELIAITLELTDTINPDVVLFTNDYSMENMCVELNISYSSLYKKGIMSKITWEVYCPFCNSVHNPEDLHKMCERCGLKLKRRPKKKNKKREVYI